MGRRVIVADDSKTVQKVIRIILAPAGYEVECFDNGSDALMAIKNSPPSLVLADIGMQHMDGYELGILVKNEPRLKNTPVILMYGANYEINYEKFISSGARDKILKPFDAKMLNEMVRKHALKAVDSPGMDVINIDTPSATAVPKAPLPQDWDMDSFAEPEIPDMKKPLKEVEEQVVLKKEFKDLELENVDLEDESELSEEESHDLYKEYDLEEKNDGTIQFKGEEISSPIQLLDDEKTDIQAESDMGLWNDRYYVDSPQDPSIPDLKIEMDEEEIKDIPKSKDLFPESELNRKLLEISEPLIRKMLQNILPDVAERMVREELNKLLAED